MQITLIFKREVKKRVHVVENQLAAGCPSGRESCDTAGVTADNMLFGINDPKLQSSIFIQ